MNKNKVIKKISFNVVTISSVLLGGVVLSNNYKLTPEIVCLTGTFISSTCIYVKKRKY